MQAEALVSELEPVAGQLLDRHLRAAREWFPHELIPYERGRPNTSEAWSAADSDLGGVEIPDGVRSALYVNLLTEDNLPYYSRDIQQLFGEHDAWGTWARRWTAEEGRHSMAIYGYLMVTRAIDPVALERGRMCQVSTAQVPAPVGPHDGLVYLTLQELAHAHLAPQHRQAAGRPDRLRAHGAGGVGREPPPPLLPRPRRRRLPGRSVGHGAGHRARGEGVRHARRGHPELRSPLRPHRPRRHLRPRHPPQPDRRAGRGEAVAHRRAGGAHARGRGVA